MIVRRFLTWARLVAPAQRAEGVRALALGYLYSPMPEEMREEAEAALTAMLEDPSPLVRQALAEAFASATDAPRHCVIALAYDQSDIAAPVLGRSPLLRDEDLIDCAAHGDAAIQSAIASRACLSAAVSAALAQAAPLEALIALALNEGADLPDFSQRLMLERFGADGALREALLARPNAPASVRSDIVHAAASALSAFVTEAGWLSADRAERLQREVSDRAAMVIAVEAAQDDPLDGCMDIVRHLRVTGRLTPALMLRALLCGDRALFEAALAELSGQPLARACGQVRYHQGGGFAALYTRARMPADLLSVFRAALAAQDVAGAPAVSDEARLSRRLIRLVLDDCAGLEGEALARVSALLRRFDSEAARQDARDVTQRLVQGEQSPHLPLLEVRGNQASLLALATVS
jgi:hypothetical protein